MSKVRLAIIGNGMVGHRFIEDLLDKSDAANFDITVFCEEPRIAYEANTSPRDEAAFINGGTAGLDNTKKSSDKSSVVSKAKPVSISF
ncbi:hypothetical protein E2K61_14295, partial [Escherichia coli]